MTGAVVGSCRMPEPRGSAVGGWRRQAARAAVAGLTVVMGLSAGAAARAEDAAGSGRPTRILTSAAVTLDTVRPAARDTAAGASARGAADSVSGEAVVDRDPVVAAAREYRRSGVARTVEEGEFITFPYGHAQPTVTCAPLRACVIELAPREIVLSKIAGDTQRWEIQLAPAGTDGRTPLVVVKPHDCGLTTNLVLATTAGRIYDLTLDSPPCPRAGHNPHGVYARHVRFYYPDAMVQAWAAPAAATAPSAATTNIEAFNFAYRITRDRHFPWMPIAVFDDGAHCYIELPPQAAHRDAPALFVIGDDGNKTLINYSVIGDAYVTDRVFRVAELVEGGGEGGRERGVRLVNLRYDAVPGAANGSAGTTSGASSGGDR